MSEMSPRSVAVIQLTDDQVTELYVLLARQEGEIDPVLAPLVETLRSELYRTRSIAQMEAIDRRT